MESDWLVLDLGGSIVSPGMGPDLPFVRKIAEFLTGWLRGAADRALGVVVGGGAPARIYQEGLRSLRKMRRIQSDSGDLDRLGIAATRLNAEFLRCALRDSGLQVYSQILCDYWDLPSCEVFGEAVVGCGWKPGFSTDYDAVLLAEHCGCRRLLCLSNIAEVYTDDPEKNPDAKAVSSMNWDEYQLILGEQTWNPGARLPFDPVATKHAADIGLELVFLDGRNLTNLGDFLLGKPFRGTQIYSAGEAGIGKRSQYSK